MVITDTHVFRGRTNVYLSYYAEGRANVRLLSGEDDDAGEWFSFVTQKVKWIEHVAMVLQAWENSVKCFFIAVYPERAACWTIATAGEEGRGFTTLYSSWFSDGLWHVGCYKPKGEA